MSNEEKKREIEYAKKTVQVIQGLIKDELASLKKQRKDIVKERTYFIDYFYELKDDEKLDLLKSEAQDTRMYESTLNILARLGRQLKEPYFARFDFTEENEEKENFYVGIHTVKRGQDNKIIVYDWRAPISSLYYEHEPGPAYYEAPIGEIRGLLHFKRRYVFKEGKLIKFSDIHMPSDDDFLYEVLSKNSDERMKTIVQTIQKEQNTIIRDYIEGVSVIQGCAGSGKSSIALHKAAYVLYHFRDRLKNQQLAIISPNKVFSEYISTVLPDLGEENINQIIPEEIVDDFLFYSGETTYLSRIDSQEFALSAPRDEAERLRKISAFKNSKDFSDLIKKYVKFLEKDLFVAQDLYLDQEVEEEISKDLIEELFYEEFKGEKLFERSQSIAKKIGSLIKVESLLVIDYIKEALNGMYSYRSLLQLYYRMYTDEDFLKGLNFDLSIYKPDHIMWEDACGIGFMSSLMYEFDFDSSLFYLIADEAQDFPPVFLELIKRRFKSCNMLFVGDRKQLVYENTGEFAKEIKEIIRRRPFRNYELKTNYRSTIEITKFASQFIEGDGDTSIRSGTNPEIIKVNKEDMSKKVSALAKDMLAKGYNNIALLCKSNRIAKDVNLDFDVVDKVKVLPIYLAKGLEFDGVILWDVSNKAYYSESDRKILYTASTRAMHELKILYSDEISVFIKSGENDGEG